MSRDDLVRFARRDWAAAAAAKEAQWRRQKAAMSPALSVHHRVGQALRAVTRTSG